MPSRIIFGSLDSGSNPVLSNPSDVKSRFETKFGGTFSTPKAAKGQLATHFNASHVPDTWTSDPYYMMDQNSSGAQYGVSLKYDSGANQLYADVSGSNTFGTAALTDCEGCTDCLIVIGSNGKQSGCTCFDDVGSCNGAILT